MSSIIIKDLRITFIWTDTYFDMLMSDAPDIFPHGFLSHGYAYKAQLKKLLTPSKIPSGLTLPWRTVAGQLFWTRYLGNRIPGHIKPTLAWKKLVPLRMRPQVDLCLPPSDTRLQTEAYCYPFGDVLAITLHFRGSLPLDDAVTLAQSCAKEEMIEMVTGGQTIAQGRLNNVARKCLDTICVAAIGQASQDSSITTDPLTIATVVRGSDVDPAVQLKDHPEKDDIQHALEGLVNWQPNWKTVTLPSLDEPGILLDVSSKSSSPGDALYAGKSQVDRGRVVWFPGRFTLSSVRLNSLACYHRNLMTATAHAESLARFVEKIVDRFPRGEYRNRPNVRWCAQNAAIILKDLYEGSNTYRSWSLRKQIKDSACIPAINTMLADIGVQPIK